jgi:hypothetical protein
MGHACWRERGGEGERERGREGEKKLIQCQKMFLWNFWSNRRVVLKTEQNSVQWGPSQRRAQQLQGDGSLGLEVTGTELAGYEELFYPSRSCHFPQGVGAGYFLHPRFNSAPP